MTGGNLFAWVGNNRNGRSSSNNNKRRKSPPQAKASSPSSSPRSSSSSSSGSWNVVASSKGKTGDADVVCSQVGLRVEVKARSGAWSIALGSSSAAPDKVLGFKTSTGKLKLEGTEGGKWRELARGLERATATLEAMGAHAGLASARTAMLKELKEAAALGNQAATAALSHLQ